MEQALNQEQNNRQFCLNLYNLLKSKKPEENLFFSALNIQTALAMALNGAKGTTAEEIQKALNLKELNTTNTAFLQYLATYNSEKNVALALANKIWTGLDSNISEDFQKAVKEFYGSEAQPVDFAKNTEAAQTINTWVEQQTNDKIKDLVQADSLNALTQLVITTAIYFKGTWQNTFEKDRSRPMPFKLANNTTKQTTFMSNQDTFSLYQQQEFQMLELDYLGRNMSFVVVLPQQGKALSDIESLLTVENLEKFEKGLVPQPVSVLLPKFKFDFQVTLKSHLEKLGMQQAFTDKADFTGISQKEGVCVTDVCHKAFVEVNEEGTEAAAATEMMFGITSIPQYTDFVADRPFLFYIREKTHGNILFFGKYNQPSE